MTENKSERNLGRKITVILIVIFMVLTGIVWFAGVYFFQSHFFPGTTINEFNCSFMTAQEVENLLQKKTASYALAIQTRGNGQEGISAKEVNLIYTPDGSAKALIKSQNQSLWFLAFSKSAAYNMKESTKCDQALLETAVDSLNCMQAGLAPSDAHLEEGEDGFEIIPEKEGNLLNREKTLQTIKNAMLSGQHVLNLEEADCYEKPSVYKDDAALEKQRQQMDEITDIIVTYDFADRTEVVDRSVIKDWIVVDENGDCVLERDRVAAYIDKLGYKYDTLGLSHSFRTYQGEDITVSGGDYGWVIDQEKETDALMEIIHSGETQVRIPIYSYSAWSRDTNDIGYTYIEINLTNQKLVVYKDGAPVVETFVVTGNPNIPDCETPTGCYAIDAMMSPAVLTGEDYQAEVNFWLPFNGNVGIHDAAWRTEFGNNLYLFEGSHGCVNVPYDKAAQIYQYAQIGMPVVVYE